MAASSDEGEPTMSASDWEDAEEEDLLSMVEDLEQEDEPGPPNTVEDENGYLDDDHYAEQDHHAEQDSYPTWHRKDRRSTLSMLNMALEMQNSLLHGVLIGNSEVFGRLQTLIFSLTHLKWQSEFKSILPQHSHLLDAYLEATFDSLQWHLHTIAHFTTVLTDEPPCAAVHSFVLSPAVASFHGCRWYEQGSLSMFVDEDGDTYEEYNTDQDHNNANSYPTWHVKDGLSTQCMHEMALRMQYCIHIGHLNGYSEVINRLQVLVFDLMLLREQFELKTVLPEHGHLLGNYLAATFDSLQWDLHDIARLTWVPTDCIAPCAVVRSFVESPAVTSFWGRQW